MKKLSYILLVIVFVIITFYYFMTSREVPTFDTIEYHYFDRFRTVIMGKYEQSGDAKTKKLEPIEWYVLDETDDLALLITKKTIISIKYNIENKDISWEKSILRMFLNAVFYKENFTAKERESIVSTNVKNEMNDTIDYIYILSEEELKKYFKNDNERMAQGTEYAKSFGMTLVSTMPTAENPIEDATYYWVRNKGYTNKDVACVNFDGHINKYGFDCTTDGMGARPCMWVKKEALWGK